ncbi:hypothetical protein QR98_0053010 [Sarcoptes scabiei]|uniref:Uncharacterized protein n=1 Tax=Sarcoptes scabiei TaxID=52283 RepID=A0A132A789_SARSC|nr:hypothetical protein QR98_0053010 [Sarcoptes scabiei]
MDELGVAPKSNLKSVADLVCCSVLVFLDDPKVNIDVDKEELTPLVEFTCVVDGSLALITILGATGPRLIGGICKGEPKSNFFPKLMDDDDDEVDVATEVVAAVGLDEELKADDVEDDGLPVNMNRFLLLLDTN